MNKLHCDLTGRSGDKGFTLIELLVSFTITALIMVMIASITNIIAKTWKETTAKMDSFSSLQGFLT